MDKINQSDTAEILKNELLKVKSKCLKLEEDMNNQINELELRESEWIKMDQEVKNILESHQNQIVRINVSGKKFMTKLETLLSIKDTLFYKLILSKRFDFNKELFLDRNPKIFSTILDYLRYKKINYQRFTNEELIDLRIEANFFEVGPISDFLNNRKDLVNFIRFDFSGAYVNTELIGTNNVEDLCDRSQMKGIVANYPGWITIEFDESVNFDEIEVGGYKGNINLFSVENGISSEIYTSIDKSNWRKVGNLPNSLLTIQRVKLIESQARFIKFQNSSYLGIGFLEINRKY